MPSNFLDVTDAYFYIPDDMQNVSGVENLPDGKIDAIGLLFSDNDISQYPSTTIDEYKIGVQFSDTYNGSKSTENMKIILSSGLAARMGLKAGDIARWISYEGSDNPYRTTIRGLVTKMPGITFSGLNTVALITSNALISMD